MELFELLQIFSMAGQKIDALWEFFVTVHLAIFGALFMFHKMKTHQLVITLISYIAFSIINLRAKIEEYELYKSILLEIKKIDKQRLMQLSSFFSGYNVDDRIIVVYTVHIIAFGFFSFLLSKSMSTNK